MFLAHLPVGCATSALLSKQRFSFSKLWLGVLGSVAPDFDILYFYTIGGRKVVHHSYWTHIPFWWLLIGFSLWILFKAKPKNPLVCKGLYLFLPNVFIHLILDTISSGIRWFWPITSYEFELITVPARYSPWYLNYFFHWTFVFELFLIGCALAVISLYRNPLATPLQDGSKTSFF